MLGEVLGGIARFVGQIFSELIVEIGFRGTGHVVLRLFGCNTDLGDDASLWTGVFVWLGIVSAGMALCWKLWR